METQQQTSQQQQQQQQQYKQQQLQQQQKQLQQQQQQQSMRQQVHQQRRQEISHINKLQHQNQQQQQQQMQNHQQPQQQQQQQQWSGEGQDNNIYNHLISQNNRGDVPEALVEEEIVYSEAPDSTTHFQSSAETRAVNTSQSKTVHHGSPRGPSPRIGSPRVGSPRGQGQSPMVIVSMSQQGTQQNVLQPQSLIRQSRELQMKNFQQQPKYVQSTQVNQGVQGVQLQSPQLNRVVQGVQSTQANLGVQGAQTQQANRGVQGVQTPQGNRGVQGGQQQAMQQNIAQVQAQQFQQQQQQQRVLQLGQPQIVQQPQGQTLLITSEEQKVDSEIAATQRLIAENNKKLLMYQQLGINVTNVHQLPNFQPIQTPAGITQTGISQSPNAPYGQTMKFINVDKVPMQPQGVSQGTSANALGIDYVGSMRFSNSGNSTQPNNTMRTILFNSAQNPGKVDVQFLDNGGMPNRPLQETNQQVITLSNNSNRQKSCVQGQGVQGQTNNFQKMANPNIQPKGVNPLMSPNVPQSNQNVSQSTQPNQNWNSDQKDGTTVIDGARVELKGGGKFEQGQIYLVKNKQGQEKKMIWTGKQLVELKENDQQQQQQLQQQQQQHQQQVTNEAGSQAGRGARGGRAQGGRGSRGRGRGGQFPGQLQGNATGVHMAQQGGGQPMDMSPSRGQGQAFNTQTPIVPGAQVRTPGTMVRPVRAGTPRQPSPQTGPALFSQPRVQVIHTQAGLRAAIPSMVRQPMVINTSSLMPPAQGSQKLASGTNTNLARAKAGVGDGADKNMEGQEGIDRLAGGDKSDSGIDSDVPKHILEDPDLIALCQFCGIQSQLKSKCERCGRKFNTHTKFISKDPEAKRRKLEDGASKPESAVTKKSFYGQKLQEQNQVYKKILSINGPGGITVRGVKKMVRGSGDRGRGRGLSRGQGRIRNMMHPPETVTISSDEEEEETVTTQSSKPATPKPQPPTTTQSQASLEVTPSPSSSQRSVSSGDVPESPIIPSIPISSKVDNKPRVDKMEDEKGVSKKGQREKSPSPEKLTVYLHARTVRVGTFRGVPIEPIQLSDQGIDFYLEGIQASYKFQIYPREIQQCLARFGKGTCLLFFLTTPSAGERVRCNLGIEPHLDPLAPFPEIYFDPTSHEMCYQMITVLLDSVDNEHVYEFGRVMEIYRKCGHVLDSSFYLELNDEEADEVLKQSTQPMSQNASGDGQYTYMEEGRSPSPPKIGFVGPIVKLLTYPPPPAVGSISITNEDLYCLQEGEFLNDVIIDFYLKYLLLEKLSEEDKKRTHVFSSFFWKRLTQRVRALDDDGLSLPVKRHARVKTWTRNVDLFKKDFIVVPINEHAHWFLAIICYPGEEDIEEVNFIPKPHTAPLPPELSVPTPPEPRDDEEDMDMDEMDSSENPLPEEGIPKTDANTNGKDQKPTENSQDSDEVKSDKVTNGGEDKNSEEKSDSDKTESSSEKTEQTQESNGSENSQNTESMEVSQNSETAEQGERKDALAKGGKNGKREPTPSRVSPSSMLAPAGKPDKALAGDRIVRGQAISQEKIKADKLTKGTDYFVGLKQPCIIVFDSLLGPSRSRVVQVLKEYLMVEWSNKKGGTEYNRQLIKGTVPKVPQQTNYSDCGVFMLQYVESFFEDPIQDFVTPMKGLYDWFSLEKIEKKRDELRDLIIGLKEKYESKNDS